MRHELACLRDILKAADELIEFVASTDESRFLASRLEQSFVFHRFVIIGEAVNAIPGEMQARYPEVVGANRLTAEPAGACVFRHGSTVDLESRDHASRCPTPADRRNPPQRVS